VVLGVVLGLVPEDPPDPPEPLDPPMFGQFAPDPECVCGVPDPPDGAVVLGADEGAGLAAETAATPPPTSSSAEMAAVRTVRRRPLVVLVATGSAGASTGGVVGAGTSGWNIDSM
jgi:hypothetical protein